MAKIHFQMGPLCVFSEAEPVWHRGKNLAPVSFSPSISCSLTSRDTCRYWNDYVPGLCRYPDVHRMIKKKEPGECISPSFLPPLALPSLVLVVFFSSYLLLRGWDRPLAGDESWGAAWGITNGRWFSCLRGRQEEWGEERGRWIEGWSPARSSREGVACSQCSPPRPHLSPWSVRGLWEY